MGRGIVGRGVGGGGPGGSWISVLRHSAMSAFGKSKKGNLQKCMHTSRKQHTVGKERPKTLA
jgi:hypothetical protein